MMLPTHVVSGLALATPLFYFAPEVAPVAVAGIVAGSIVPDLDLYHRHRRTFHYPTIYTLGALPAVVAALIVPRPAVVAVAAFLVGAAVHCQLDRYGGGLELRPWEQTSEQAVYDHVRGRWRRPKRWVQYDGSPGDLLLLCSLSLPLLVVLAHPYRTLVGAALVVGVVYAVVRRRLASLAPIVVESLPTSVTRYLPDRYRS